MPAVDAAPSIAKDEPSNGPNVDSADQHMGHEQEEEEEDDDDDDVDFNLGGGSGGGSGAVAPSGGDTNMHQPSASGHDDRQSTPPYGSVHRASAKDEG